MKRAPFFLGGYLAGLLVAVALSAIVSCGATPAPTVGPTPAVQSTPDGTSVTAPPTVPPEAAACGMFPAWFRNPTIAGRTQYGDSVFVIVPDCDGKVQRWIRESIVREQRPWLRHRARGDTVQLSSA